MFDVNTWKLKIRERFKKWEGHWQKAKEAGICTLYGFLCSTALWPIVEASQKGEVAALVALGQVATGIGGGLIGNMIQKWKDETQAARELEDQVGHDPGLRSALDDILERLEVLVQAKDNLNESQWQWFSNTLRTELQKLGNLDRFQCILAGSGAIAGAPHAKAGGERAVVGDKIESSTIVTGDKNRFIKTGGGTYIERQEIRQEQLGDDPEVLEQIYLTRMVQKIRDVPLSGIDPRVISDEESARLELAAVYTALMTQQAEREGMEALSDKHKDPFSRRLSAVEMLNQEQKLVILGEPGAGKSTFINFLTLCMAGERLNLPEVNLKKLTEPLPSDKEYDDEKARPQPWDHGPLLPVRLVLRDFAARGLPPAGQRADGGHLWDFVVSDMGTLHGAYAEYLKRHLQKKGGIVMLDGLDEVPEVESRREQVKEAVTDFASSFPACRFLVTSRTYAYQKQDWKLQDFAEVILSPFIPSQINRFVESWYNHLAFVRRMHPEDARGRAVLLQATLKNNPRLAELASRPLLLTLMASLHAWHGGNLPEKRELLYADAVDLLLDNWERAKIVCDSEGKPVIQQQSLAEWLKVDRSAVRSLLNELAFEAHRDQPHLLGTADIPQMRLVDGLVNLSQNPDVKPRRIIEYISQRAGLLMPRGHGVYAFPHRTFQEYLAACHLTDADFPDDMARLALTDPDRWREVTLLAGAKSARGAASNIWLLVEALCYEEPPAQIGLAKGIAALLAGQMLKENDAFRAISDRNKPKADRLKRWLLQIVQTGALSPVDRTAAGNVLAQMGDPRFRHDAWYLPDEPLLGFVEVPEGKFLMGTKKKDIPALMNKFGGRIDWYEGEVQQHEVYLSPYYISRYPVTAAQFHAFLKVSGYKPMVSGSLLGVANQPVVNVTWYDALEYCHWLTETLRDWDHTPQPLARFLREEGWQITLPSEAQWEKAARGEDGRIFPWGNDPGPDCANYGETGIGATSTVGCFPSGASPYDIMDMCGNVWEWTRTLWGKHWEPDFSYPYNTNDGREDLTAGKNVLRVLRGGVFRYESGDVRCATGLGGSPGDGLREVGFRVVLSPAQSGL